MELRGGQPLGDVTPVDHALEQLVTGLDHLVKVVEDGGLDHYDNLQLVGFLQSFERFRNRLALVDHRVVADGDRGGLPDALTQPSMMRVLMHVLRLSPGEASRRSSAAQACGLRTSLLGESLPPVRPQLAAAQRDGLVSSVPGGIVVVVAGGRSAQAGHRYVFKWQITVPRRGQQGRPVINQESWRCTQAVGGEGRGPGSNRVLDDYR